MEIIEQNFYNMCVIGNIHELLSLLNNNYININIIIKGFEKASKADKVDILKCLYNYTFYNNIHYKFIYYLHNMISFISWDNTLYTIEYLIYLNKHNFNPIFFQYSYSINHNNISIVFIHKNIKQNIIFYKHIHKKYIHHNNITCSLCISNRYININYLLVINENY